MIEYIRFRAFAAPILIEALFWALTLVGIGLGFGAFIVSVNVGIRHSALLGLAIAIPTAIFTALGIIAWRVACEGAIVLFRIHEELRDGRGEYQ